MFARSKNMRDTITVIEPIEGRPFRGYSYIDRVEEKTNVALTPFGHLSPDHGFRGGLWFGIGSSTCWSNPDRSTIRPTGQPASVSLWSKKSKTRSATRTASQ